MLHRLKLVAGLGLRLGFRESPSELSFSFSSLRNYVDCLSVGFTAIVHASLRDPKRDAASHQLTRAMHAFVVVRRRVQGLSSNTHTYL